MADSLGGIWTALAGCDSWKRVDNDVVQCDGYLSDATDFLKRCFDNNYVIRGVEQWSSDWFYVGRYNQTMGFFMASWFLSPNSMIAEYCGDKGNWGVVTGPQAYYWGGQLFTVSSQCNTPEEAARFLRTLTTDAKTMKQYTLATSAMCNNQKAMQEIIDEGTFTDPLLGGQEIFGYLHQTAMAIESDHQNRTSYDWDLDTEYYAILKDNIDSPKEEILGKYYDSALSKFPALS